MSAPFQGAVEKMVREGIDLSLPQCAVLLAAVEAEPATRPDANTVRALKVRLNMPSGAPITRAFDRLTELGLGERCSDPRDRRSVYFVPSARGMRLAVEVMGARL